MLALSFVYQRLGARAAAGTGAAATSPHAAEE
jgi:hypothetical protein